MPDLGVRLSNMNPEERAAIIERAGAALRDGQSIVLPTDTLYGIVTRADETGAALLNEITGTPDITTEPSMTLHLADLDQILEHLVLDAATVRRLVHCLLPGPSRLLIEQPASAILAVCTALKIPLGIINSETHIAVRVPDHPVCRQVLRSSGVACVARRLGAAIWAQGENPGTDLTPIPDGLTDDSSPVPTPALIIDDGPTLHQQGSTTVRLSMDGRIEVSDEGAISEREVLKNLERTILFVCTGNTCRSPMAEAIARDLIRKDELQGMTTHVASAGVATHDGMPINPDAAGALTGMGLAVPDHQSKQLTLAMIDHAEVIYTMTPTHAQAIMTMAPNSVHKVFVLDELEGVPDPIGQGAEVYQHTAEKLRELITRRLEEIRI